MKQLLTTIFFTIISFTLSSQISFTECSIDFLAGASQTDFGDINNDGLIDLAAAGVEANAVYAYVNNSNGYDKTLFFPQFDIEFLRLADLNQDDFLDFVILTSETKALKLVINAGGAVPVFSELIELDYGEFPSSLEVADVNQDNLMDILIGFGDRSFVHLINEGNLVFSKNSSFESESIIIQDMDIVDINLDGHNDIFISTLSPNKIYVYYNDGSSLQFDKILIDTADILSIGIEAGDLNNDGLVDLVVSSLFSGLILYTNNGQDFTKEVIDPELKISSGIRLADLDNDNDLEIVLNENDQFLHYYENMEEGFNRVLISDVGISGDRTNVFDVDQDGDLDILASSFFNDQIYLFKMTCLHQPLIIMRQNL